ncbi:protein adenylyltransferase SelO [Cohnella fermenti]|uniref:Protein nucleotidyltransferase YdiU n=1 Tax=Cohnella fermenti TaxID=2565925 RepID=A0A4S4C1Y8_9BACL|nr:YdiU family protein [Cohnella fermenti]THF81682.1 YdiU family protein [Cohnella fermenti]
MSEEKTGLDAAAGWNFDNSYSRLPESYYSRIEPTPVRSPRLLVLNEPLAESLGLNAGALRQEGQTAALAGNRIPEGAAPLAQAYGGHQFGHFNRLGDGRAILMGEQRTPSGERFDIQWKGSGPTPYSRRGDGRAALGPMLREYIVSEAMHGLGIPTTRSLAVVATGEIVHRETELPGAVLTRVASSHLRVGTFQYLMAWGTPEDVRTLADYAIRRHYPDAADEANPYLAFLERVVRSQARLIAQWQLVGFIHGVMNTDNMAIGGETIDYGPCAFMDAYDPATVFSSIDVQGRYAYGNQPPIGGWNLARFAETLLPLLHPDMDRAVALAEETLSDYPELYLQRYLAGMRAKLGLFGAEERDESLIKDLLDLMQEHGADYTNTFRSLTLHGTAQGSPLAESPAFADWQRRWEERGALGAPSPEASRELMRGSNPAVIARNHRVEEALEAAGCGDLGVMERLLAALQDPFAYSASQEEYAELPPEPELPYQTFCGT